MRVWLCVLVTGLAGLAAAYETIDASAENLQALLGQLKAEEDLDPHSVTLGSSNDDNIRMALLQKSVIACNNHNHDHPDSFEAGVNKFSIMTDEEKLQYTGLKNDTEALMKRDFHSLTYMSKRSMLNLHARQAATVDYTDDLPDIKNQGGCGSCWAFGAAGALEYQLNRKRGSLKKKVISEEQLLDCTYPTRNGCQGGWPTHCYDWVRKAGTNKPANYIASMEDYPYEGKDGDCITTAKNHISGFQLGVSRYIRGEDPNYAAVGNPEIGVLSVAIAVVSDFYSYKSNVYDTTLCANKNINHAVDIVGYGVMDGKNYWNVRNSWGSHWGDKGYIKMIRGGHGTAGVCMINQYSHYPVVTGKSDDQEEEDEDDSDGNDGNDGDDDDEEEHEGESCYWIEVEKEKYKGRVPGCENGLSMEEAQDKCEELSEKTEEQQKTCKAITCHKKKGCTCVPKTKGKEHKKYTSYELKCCAAGLVYCDEECKHEHTCGKDNF